MVDHYEKTACDCKYFAVAEDILTLLTCTDSEGSDDHADTVVLPAPDREFTES